MPEKTCISCVYFLTHCPYLSMKFPLLSEFGNTNADLTSFEVYYLSHCYSDGNLINSVKSSCKLKQTS